MFFNVYGDTSIYQMFGWILVFCALIVTNEIARRTKAGGIAIFVVLPIVLSVYFIIVNILGATGVWADSTNWTWYYMRSWFHYAKLYAATIGCIGFMMIKYKWGIGAKKWFRPFPFLIVAINILIACVSDFESGVRGYLNLQQYGTRWWVSSENVMVYGGWWNYVNGVAGLINIACMTGWWGIYSSKDKNKQDMIWADMTWVYILAYDVWNFEYTYNCLPTHAWYCGLALLLAPTFAAFFWNKGGWIQNRANTLSIWCMFAQVVPVFQDRSKFSIFPSLFPKEFTYQDMDVIVAAVNKGDYSLLASTAADPTKQGFIAILALVINVAALTAILTRAYKTKTNPYTHEIWKGTKDFEAAMARAEAQE